MDEKTYPISVQRLHQSLKEHVAKGQLDTAVWEVTAILFGQNADKKRYHERRKAQGKNGIVELSQAKVKKLAAAIEPYYAEPHKLISTWFPKEFATWTLETGDADRAEIEIMRFAIGGNLIRNGEHSPVDEYVQVFVDKVRFRQKVAGSDANAVAPLEGKYVRIEVPGRVQGSVVLPVDLKTREVLLVTQYRHPQRRFLTEAPRGFGTLGLDKDAVDTAIREMDEESAAIPNLDADGGSEIFFLKRMFTDTGKLAEAPSYFLAFVDREIQTRRLNETEPLMEDPVWVSLPKFYDAVFLNGPLTLEFDDYSFALTPEWRQRLNSNPPIKQGQLHISDAFTFIVAALALPKLTERLGPEIIKDILRV
jgi:hypothetical protein